MHFDPEDGIRVCLWNVGTKHKTTDYYNPQEHVSENVCNLLWSHVHLIFRLIEYTFYMSVSRCICYAVVIRMWQVSNSERVLLTEFSFVYENGI
jgi:hypothetical protein